MKPITMVLVIAQLSLLGSCKARRTQSEVKDVDYISDDLSTRFTLKEVCEPNWTSDDQCKIGLYVAGQLKKESPARAVYQLLGLDVPSGQAGEQEISARQILVNRITSDTARQAAQEVLNDFKAKVAQKNELKSNLAKGNEGAVCFGESAIGNSGVLCSSLERAMAGGGGGGGNPGSNLCPPNYVRVPKIGNSSQEFCVAKYEMKKDASGRAVSQAASEPWKDISRDDAAAKCKEIGRGYDLISNGQWQAVAQNIEITPSNWSTGTVGQGQVSQGNYTLPIRSEVAASDSDPCFGTGHLCSMSTWHAFRRVHTLPNGGFVWDFSGNTLEWVLGEAVTGIREKNFASQVSDNAKVHYGPLRNHSSLSSGEYGGLGHVDVIGDRRRGYDALIRGGSWAFGGGKYVGVFSVLEWPGKMDKRIGFRCTYLP